MAVVTYTLNTVRAIGPRYTELFYEWVIPSGSSVTDHAFFSPVMTIPANGKLTFTAAHPGGPSAANAGPRLTIFGSNSPTTITPSARNWTLMRGDTVSGANIVLNAVSSPGIYSLQTDTRHYRVRVSAGAANANVTSPWYLSGMISLGRT